MLCTRNESKTHANMGIKRTCVRHMYVIYWYKFIQVRPASQMQYLLQSLYLICINVPATAIIEPGTDWHLALANITLTSAGEQVCLQLLTCQQHIVKHFVDVFKRVGLGGIGTTAAPRCRRVCYMRRLTLGRCLAKSNTTLLAHE